MKLASQQIWVDSSSSKCYLITEQESPSNMKIKEVKQNGEDTTKWDAKDFGLKPRKLCAEQKMEINKIKPLYRPASAKLDGYFQMPSRSVQPYENCESEKKYVTQRQKNKAMRQSVETLQKCASTENLDYISLKVQRRGFGVRHLSAATNHEEIQKCSMKLILQSFDAYIDRDKMRRGGTAKDNQQRIGDFKIEVVPNSTIHRLPKPEIVQNGQPKSDLDLKSKSTRPGTANRCEVVRMTTPSEGIPQQKSKRLQSACSGKSLNQNASFACYQDFKTAEQTQEKRIPNYSIKKQHQMATLFSLKPSNQQLVTTTLALKSPPLSPKEPPKQQADNKQKPVAAAKPDIKPKEKTLQKTTWVCIENIEDTPEDGGQSWAGDNRIKVKSLDLIRQENRLKNLPSAQLIPGRQFRCTTKNTFNVEILNNKGQRVNDLEILRKANPAVFKHRDDEVCKELAGKVESKRQKLLLQIEQEKKMRLAEKILKAKIMESMKLF